METTHVSMDPKEKAKKCNQEIQDILNKHGCKIVAIPTIKVEEDGTLKVMNEVKITPMVKVFKPLIKPDKENGRPKYIN